ncbi:MAG: single-stranded DNA-binding protein [Planctomycetota bacterium]
MASYNRVILMGNLTRDPELRYTASNMPVAKIGLAVNDRVKNRQTDQWEERANFFDCTAFGRTAELVNQYFTKGRPIFIEGKLRWDSWEDKQSGAKRSKVEVIIDNFQFVGGREDGTGGGGGGGRGSQGGRAQQPASSAPASRGAADDYAGGPQYDPVDPNDIPF